MGRRTPGAEPSGKTYFFNAFFLKKMIFGLQTTFIDGFNVIMSFLAQK